MNRQMRRSLRKHQQAASTVNSEATSDFPTTAAPGAIPNPAHLSHFTDPFDDSLFAEALQPALPTTPFAPVDQRAQPPQPQQPHATSIPPLSQLSETSTDFIDWLWQDRIPYGALTLLEGDHNAGKTLLALTIAACVTRGLPLPGSDPCFPGPVLLVTPHDNLSVVVRPRLEAAGGDPSQVFILNRVLDAGHHPYHPIERVISLPSDLPLLQQQIEHLRPSLVIIDPLTVVFDCSSRDRFGPPQPASLLADLDTLAQHTGCAILLVRPVRTRASDLLSPRVYAPTSFDLVRASLLLVSHPKDPEQIYLVPSRHGLGPKPALLAYRIVCHDDLTPTLSWLDDAQAQLDALLGKPDSVFSHERHSILHFLQSHPTPQSIDAIITTLALDYEPARKMLQRMTSAGDLTSPSRGLYTISPSATATTTTDVPNVPTVPNVATKHLQSEEEAIPSTTDVPTDPPAQSDITHQHIPTHVPDVATDPIAKNNIVHAFLTDYILTDPMIQPINPTHIPTVPTVPSDPMRQTSIASDHLTDAVPTVTNTAEQEPSMDNTLAAIC